MDLLETKRLILRELRLADCDDIVRFAGDAAINHHLSFGDLDREEGARKYLKKAVADAQARADMGETRHSYKLAILLKPDREFIGSCWLDITEPAHHRASIGYFIEEKYWGQGLATEAVQALVAFGLDNLKLHRIEATCDADHQASRRVLEKALFSREARLRHKRRRGAVWNDSCLYARISQS